MTVSAHSDDTRIDWELDIDDSALLLGLAYVFPSILGGVVVLVGGSVLVFVAAAAVAGEFGRALGVLVVAVFALLSRRYLPAVLDTDLRQPFFARFSRRGLLVGSLVGAVSLLGSAWVHSAAPFVVVVVSLVPLVLTAGFPTSGHANLTAATLVVDETEIPLGDVRAFRSVSVDTFAVCWLSYARGVPTASRVVVLPADHVDAVATLVDMVPESSTDPRSTLGRAERTVAGLLGLGMAAIGPVLWLVLPPGDGSVIALYAGALFGFFGVVLLWYAYSA